MFVGKAEKSLSAALVSECETERRVTGEPEEGLLACRYTQPFACCL